MSPSISKVEAHASNESTMSDYYRFSQAILSLPPMEGFDTEFNLGVEQGDMSQSGGPHTQFILYADSAI